MAATASVAVHDSPAPKADALAERSSDFLILDAEQVTNCPDKKSGPRQRN
jgi:hypothetical protein